jgi:diadenylate cyclase
LPASVINDIVARYGSLQKVMRATTEDLEAVTGVEEGTARTVKDGLARLAESSILDRYG